MNTSNRSHIGIQLIQQGWKQGSFIENAFAPKTYTIQACSEQEASEGFGTDSAPIFEGWKVKEVALNDNDLLVIASQACDIQKAPDKEPYIEAIRAYWTSERSIIHDAKRNSVYYFLITERVRPGQEKEALIVDLRSRLLLEKESLLRFPPLSYFDEEGVIFRRFRQWLGRRYLRQALANELVIAVQKPIVNAIRELRPQDTLHNALDHVREIRFLLLNETAPYDIEMLFIFDADNERSTAAEEESALLGNWIEKALKRTDKIASYSWQKYSTKEISVHDYENTYELALHEFSLP